MIRVLMVCTGNICRSPTAEGVLRDLVQQRGLADQIEVDSAGMIAYHSGESPDRRSAAEARRRGIEISDQRARQLEAEDFETFDHLLAMDRSHLRDMQAMAPKHLHHKISLLLTHAGMDRDVPDPYYGGHDGFVTTFDLVDQGCRAFLDGLD